MPWSRIASSGVATSVFPGSHPHTLALGAAVSVGHRLVAGIIATTPSLPLTIDGVTDSLGHTYTLDKSEIFGASSNRLGAVYSVTATAAGTPTISVAWTGTGTMAIVYAAYSGVAAMDVTAAADFGGGTATAAADSGVTSATGAANELVIGLHGDAGSNRTFIPTSATTVTEFTPTGAADIVLTEADAGAQGSTPRAQGTWSDVAQWVAVCVVYQLTAQTTLPNRPRSRPFPFRPGSARTWR